MIGVLVIVEARNPFQQELYTENIDKYSNVCMNCSGILDIWEGTLSWIQTARIRNIRFALSSVFGLETKLNNQKASFISKIIMLFIQYIEMLCTILIYDNMLTANPLEYRYTMWVHSSAEPL